MDSTVNALVVFSLEIEENRLKSKSGLLQCIQWNCYQNKMLWFLENNTPVHHYPTPETPLKKQQCNPVTLKDLREIFQTCNKSVDDMWFVSTRITLLRVSLAAKMFHCGQTV